MGEVVSFVPEELGFAIDIGEITVSECRVNQFKGSSSVPPQFTRGYGLSFGHSERKVMAMALVDRGLRAKEFGEASDAPAQDEEFVLSPGQRRSLGLRPALEAPALCGLPGGTGHGPPASGRDQRSQSFRQRSGGATG